MNEYERGWAMFRLMDGEMKRVSQVVDKDHAMRLLEFDDFMASYMVAEGLTYRDFYVRPTSLQIGTA